MNITKNTQVALELIGFVTTAVGVAMLFYGDKTISATLVAVISAALLLHSIKQALSAPITHKRIHMHVDILDSKGHKAIGRKDKTIVVNEKNVTTLIDRNFSASGRLEFLRTSIGEMLAPFDEGGTKSVYTVFKAPLPLNTDIDFSIEFVMWDTFTESQESFTHLNTVKAEEIGIHVRFPRARPVRVPKAYCLYKGEASELHTLVTSDGGRQLDLVVSKPRLGSKYFVEWEW